MHAPFRNHFAVEMGQFLLKPDVLHEHGAARAGGQGMIIVGHRRAGIGGERVFIFHIVCHDAFLLGLSEGIGCEKTAPYLLALR